MGLPLTGEDKATISSFDDYSSTYSTSKYNSSRGEVDFGLTFGAGIEVKHFLIGFTYDQGITEQELDQFGHIENHQYRVFKFSVGYMWGK